MVRRSCAPALRVSAFTSIALAITLSASSTASAQTTLPSGFREIVVAQGLDGPTTFAFLPDQSVLVGDKHGRVYVVREGAPLPAPVLTIAPSEESEQGLSGLTLDPGFSTNGYIYVYYTTSPSSCPGPTCDAAARAAAANRPYAGPLNRVSRFTLAQQAIDPGSEVVIVDGIPSDSGAHNAGCMAFGPDGMLYIATGDGGEFHDHAQALDSLSGKILRVRADGSIPDDNPYTAVPEARPEIWALGFRNPWRFTFDQQGRLLVGDVGENDWEEVDVIRPGGNYGWPYFEGPDETGDGLSVLGVAGPGIASLRPPGRAPRRVMPHYLGPLYTYPHDGESAAIILGAVSGPNSPFPAALRNRLFFADLIQQHVWTLDYDLSNGTLDVEPFADGVGLTTQMLGGPDGNVWFVSFSRGVLARFEVAQPAVR